MKKAAILLLIVVSVMKLIAQEENNISIEAYYSNNISMFSDIQSYYHSSYSYAWGSTANIKLKGKTSLLTGISFSTYTKRGSYDVYDSENNIDKTINKSYKKKYFSIPVGIEHTLFNSLLLSYGVAPHYFYKAISEVETIENNESSFHTNKGKYKFKSRYLSLGLFVGVGYKIKITKKIAIPLRIEYNLVSLVKEGNYFDNTLVSSFGIKTSFRLNL